MRDGLLAAVGLAALCYAAFLVRCFPLPPHVLLPMTAGREEGGRYRIAQELKRYADSELEIELKKTAGSEEALNDLDSRQIDAALVQGGLDTSGHPNLCQVAVLHVEPLHLLVKREIRSEDGCSLAGLHKKKVNLGERGSGTYALAKEVMAFSRRRANFEFTETNLSYDDLKRETDRSKLPDAVFAVSSLPAPIVLHLVEKHHYRLMSLPIHEAFALGSFDDDDTQPEPSGKAASRIDRRFVCAATIPAYVYDMEPGDSSERIQTLGTRLLLVARKDMAPSTVRRLLEVVYNSPFSRFREPPLDARLLESPPELPWHPERRSMSVTTLR